MRGWIRLAKRTSTESEAPDIFRVRLEVDPVPQSLRQLALIRDADV